MNIKRWITLFGIGLALVAVVLLAPSAFAQFEAFGPRSERANAGMFQGGPRNGGPREGGNMLDVVAETLGMTTEELVATLDEETSIADVATTQGVAVETVIDAVVAHAEEHIQTAVENGRLTQEQADEHLAQLREEITMRINEAGLPAGPREGGPRGRPGSDRPMPVMPTEGDNV